MTGPLHAFRLVKQAVTGVYPEIDIEPDMSPKCAGEAEFDVLVTQYYQLIYEELADDLSYFRQHNLVRAAWSFRTTIKDLRTSAQHSGEDGRASRERWLQESPPNWQERGERLANQLIDALRDLEQASRTVMADRHLRARWSERAEMDPATIFDGVCLDLDLRFPTYLRTILVRNAKNAANRQSRQSPDHYIDLLRNACLQEAMHEQLVIPVPHTDVLDSLGLLGDRRAKAALLLAAGVAATTGLTGEEFLDRVGLVWATASET